MKTALLFDLDGTIVDSDPQHLRAFQKVFARHGVRVDHALYAESILGSHNDAIGDRFLAHLSRDERRETLAQKEAAYRDGLQTMEPIGGFRELLDWADMRYLPRAVVTNAPRANAERVLHALGLGGRLRTIVIGDELERSKPDPLPYLTGLERTGASARHSVAFEDSLSGLRAALGAGIAVIGLTTTLRASTLLAAGATLAVPDYFDPRVRRFIEARMRD